MNTIAAGLSLFSDQAIEEIFFNGPERVITRYKDESNSIVKVRFKNRNSMIEEMQEFSFIHGIRLDPVVPTAGGYYRFPIDNREHTFRWTFAIPPLASPEPLISFRRHRLDDIGLKDFLGVEKLTSAVTSETYKQSPVFICGATGSGKTTLMTAFLRTYHLNDRVAIIESVSEIPTLSPHWIRLVASPPDIDGYGGIRTEDIFPEVLRLRPDHIVISELRGLEGSTLLQALLSGHGRVFATLHCKDSAEFPNRMASLLGSSKRVGILRGLKPILIFLDRGSPKRITGVVKFD